MKAMKWSNTHRDIYAYDSEKNVWRQVECRLRDSMYCTAPRTLPRGTQFSYGVKSTPELERRFDVLTLCYHVDSSNTETKEK